MLTQGNLKTQSKLYNLRKMEHIGRNNSALVQYKTAGLNLNHSNRSRMNYFNSGKKDLISSHNDLLTTEVVKEVQYTSGRPTKRSNHRTIRDDEKDKSMEIVDGITEDKIIKTVKFEPKLDKKIVSKTSKNSNQYSKLRSYLKQK